MTNRQWLLEKMQNMSDEELAKAIKGDEAGICQTVSVRKCNSSVCIDCKKDWLKAEHKEPIKLSDAERVILENLPKEYKYIGRDNPNHLIVFKVNPRKTSSIWACPIEEYEYLNAFKHLFQFIKWSDNEPYNIEELLKGK